MRSDTLRVSHVVLFPLLLVLAGAVSCGDDPLFATPDEDGDAICMIEAPSRVFAGTVVGDSTQLSLTYRNLGQGVVTGVIGLSDTTTTGQGAFTLLQGGGRFTLGPGRSRVVTVGFKPTVAGTQEAMLVAPGACRAVTLEATALDPPTCTVSADTLDFGMVELGMTGSGTLFVGNQGGSALSGTVQLVSPCPNFVVTAGSGPFSLAVGESLAVSVDFVPSAEAAFSCVLDFGSQFCPPVACVGSGFGVAACSTSVFSAGSVLDLGDVLADGTGGQTAMRSFTVYNVGTGSLLSINPMLTGTGAASFQLTGPGAVSLAAGDSATYQVTFDPASSLAGFGAKSATINGLDACPITVMGEGIVGFATHISTYYNNSQGGFSACVNCHGGGTATGACPDPAGAVGLSFSNVVKLSNTGTPSNSCILTYPVGGLHNPVANTFNPPSGAAYRTVLTWINQAAARGDMFQP